MFICQKCHDRPKDWPFDGLFDSVGPCEICGEVEVCLDCHGHPEEAKS